MFVYLDFLLGDPFEEPEVIIPRLEVLVKEVLHMIVVWLKQVPTMTQTLKEMEEVELLYLVDPKAAVIHSHVEIF